MSRGRRRRRHILVIQNCEAESIGPHQRDNPDCCKYYEEYPEWLAKEYGYRPGMIWLREFDTPQGLGIQLGPVWMANDFFRDPDERPDLIPEEEWSRRGGEAWDYLHQAKYVINWCNTPWASRRTGEITDT